MNHARRMITCIYHKGPGPASKEHLLQKSLGGNLTANFVCEKCNNNFSQIDKDLARSSLVSLSRLVYQEAGSSQIIVEGEHYIVNPTTEQAVEILLMSKFKSKFKPSLLFSDDYRKVQVSVESLDDVRKLLKVIRSYRDKGQLEKIPVYFAASDQTNFTEPRVTLHSEDRLYFRVPVGFSAEAARRRLVNILSKNVDFFEQHFLKQENIPQEYRIDEPEGRLSILVHINNINRAIAKTAFNLLAHRLGADFVLQKAFDDIRNYIMGKDIRDVCFSKEDPEQDPRFVSSEDPDELPWLPRAKADEHLIMINYAYPTIIVSVDFYGHNLYFVRCGESDVKRSVPEDMFPYVYVFNYNKRTNQQLSLREIMDRLREQLVVTNTRSL